MNVLTRITATSQSRHRTYLFPQEVPSWPLSSDAPTLTWPQKATSDLPSALVTTIISVFPLVAFHAIRTLLCLDSLV